MSANSLPFRHRVEDEINYVSTQNSNSHGNTLLIVPDMYAFKRAIMEAINDAYEAGYNDHLNKEFAAMRKNIGDTLELLVKK